ncbi:MAG: pentapeptide repeat-containing protein [Microcoleaceae cyanobacterium]
MNKEQLQQEYQNGRRDFTNLDLSGLDLTDINLEGADLTGANLSGACIESANLAATNLTRSNLSNTKLYWTDLKDANLTNANLTNVEFEETNFERANLQGIQFEGTSFISCNLFEAKNIPSPVFSPLFIPTDHPDIDLVNSIHSVTEGLLCNSEFYYPYDIFLWNTVIRGELTLEKLLKEMGYLKLTSFPSLQLVEFDDEEIARDYQVLFDKIQEVLSDIEIYKFETRDIKNNYPDCTALYIIIGRTAVGDWFSATITHGELCLYTGTGDHFGGDTGISIVTEISEALTKDEAAMTKAEHLNLISAVEKADAEIEQLVWSLAEDRDLMLHKLLLAADIFLIRGMEDYNRVIQKDFYEEKILDGKKKIEQEKREAFAQLVLNNLSNIRVCFVGECDIDVYLIGQTANQDWLCIHTGLMWT